MVEQEIENSITLLLLVSYDAFRHLLVNKERFFAGNRMTTNKRMQSRDAFPADISGSSATPTELDGIDTGLDLAKSPKICHEIGRQSLERLYAGCEKGIATGFGCKKDE